MEGVVLERSSVLGARSDASLVEELLREVRELRREAAELRQEVAELRAENLELRQQVGYWKEMHRRAADRAAKLELDVDRLKGENRLLQARLFGSRTEQAGTNRSSQLEGVDDDQPAQPVRGRGQTRGRPGPRRRDHGHLPVVEESRELSAEQLACPQCGIAATPSGSADSEVLEVEVRAYRRRIRRSRYQRTCRCGCVPRTLTAPVAPKLILKGSLGISIWARLLTGKFLGHQPISRQLKQWRLQGLNLSPGTIGGGFQRLEPLFGPVYEALLKRGSLASLAQADETRWLMFVDHEDKVGHRWWLWAFLTQDAVVFRLDPTRSHAVPEEHFRDSDSLVVMVDRYSAYKAMAPVKEGRIRLAFCWAHVRRDFIEVAKGWAELRPWAIVWLRRIRDLYRAHRQRREHPWETAPSRSGDLEVRRIVGEMREQAARELSDAQLRQPCRKVLDSLQNHWEGLVRFVDDPRIPLDNNAAERVQRGPAVGRKNYYGSGALWSGQLAASLFSIFATLELWNVNPEKWLLGYLGACAENQGQAPADIAAFLPWNTATASPPEKVVDAVESS